MEDNILFYSSFSTSAVSNSNMMTTSDPWPSSTSNSNTNYQSFYFPSSLNFNNSNQYHTTDNNQFDYQTSSDISSSYLIDPYSHIFPNNYSMDSYSTPAVVYNSTPMESSPYISPTDSYQHLHSIYTDPNIAIPSASSSIDIQFDYPSTSSQWDLGTITMPSHDSMYIMFYIQK